MLGRGSPLGQLTERYIQERLSLSSGYKAELRRVARQFTAVCGALPLEWIAREHLIRFLKFYGRLSPATVNSKRRELLTLLRFAADDGLMELPQKVPRAAPLLRVPTAWSAEEIAKLLGYAGHLPGSVGTVAARVWWPALLNCCYDCGPRIGAIRRAAPQDFFVDIPAIVLQPQNTKTRRARWCPLSQQTGALISALVTAYAAPPRLLFDWPFHPNTLWKHFRRIVEGAGLYAETSGRGLFHKLRRTSGSLVEAAGGDGARHLGHTRQVFERSYLAPAIVGCGQVHLLPRL